LTSNVSLDEGIVLDEKFHAGSNVNLEIVYGLQIFDSIFPDSFFDIRINSLMILDQVEPFSKVCSLISSAVLVVSTEAQPYLPLQRLQGLSQFGGRSSHCPTKRSLNKL
jgi:hypothetical protein